MGSDTADVGQAPLAHWRRFDDAARRNAPVPGQQGPHRGNTHRPTGYLCQWGALTPRRERQGPSRRSGRHSAHLAEIYVAFTSARENSNRSLTRRRVICELFAVVESALTRRA